jgi:hypothetical protein
MKSFKTRGSSRSSSKPETTLSGLAAVNRRQASASAFNAL